MTSLGFRTDLALLKLGGSVVEDHGDHLVVRSPHNPVHYWGNFLLLRETPRRDDTDRWLERFAATFPDARHVALGVDGTSGGVEDLAGFADAGLQVEAHSVMSATTVHLPGGPNRDATYRALSCDADWAQSVELRLACDGRGHDRVEFADFTRRKTAEYRRLAEAGHGAWLGAFMRDRLVAQMGLYAASPGLARFQSVETHPDFRGRGLAGTLVHHASHYGFKELNVRTLVMVADPEYVAIRVYRSVGFIESESQLQAERVPLAENG